MKKKNTIKNLFYIFFPIIIGGIVGIIINGHINYEVLNKPLLAPPSYLFPIVWSIIYLLMGISYYLFRKNVNKDIDKTIKVYYLQLFVNALWSIIFFIFELRFFAIIWILLLLGLVITLYKLYKDRYIKSSYFIIPYIIWTLFATYLNIGFYILNR